MKNSLKQGPDELGYYGIGKDARGGCAVGETLVPVLQELSEAFEDAIKDQSFLDKFHYYCKHYIGRPSPLYYAENLTKKIGGAKILFKSEHLNHTGSHKITNCLFQTLLALRMKKTKLICESGAGAHYSAASAVAAKFNLPLIGVMGDIDVNRVNTNIIKARHYGAKLEVVKGSLKEAITAVMKMWTSSPESYYLCGSAVSAAPFPRIVQYAQSIIGKEIREQCMEQEKKLPDMIIACLGAGSNAIGSFHEFLDEPSVKLVGVEGETSAALSNGTLGIMQGMKSYMLQSEDGSIANTTADIAAGINYFSVGPQHAYLKDIGRAEYTSATNEELLESYKLVAKTEGICSALEPMAAITETVKRAKKMSKDKIILTTLCGRGEKDLDQIEEKIGKDFE
jgi:tryptophan synthase beta chain|tara:strand:- start:839 stop:2026 length:1188 start_codon:yes stop_codon:yes gene_type:complete